MARFTTLLGQKCTKKRLAAAIRQSRSDRGKMERGEEGRAGKHTVAQFAKSSN